MLMIEMIQVYIVYYENFSLSHNHQFDEKLSRNTFACLDIFSRIMEKQLQY